MISLLVIDGTEWHLNRHPKRKARMGSLADCRRCYAAGNDVGLALLPIFLASTDLSADLVK